MPVMAWLVLRPVERQKKKEKKKRKGGGGEKRREEWRTERLKRKGAREGQEETGVW